MIRAVSGVASMAPYALADLGPAGAQSLAQNESAVPPSPAAIEAGQRALRDAALYPDPDWRSLRVAIAEAHGLEGDAILCGAGSMELIGATIRAFAGPGDEVLGTAHGYLFAATAARQAGAAYRRAAEPGLRVSVETLLSGVSARTRVVFVCNPGNPTGTRILNSEILQLRKALPGDVLLMVDQAYGEFDDQDPGPIFDMVAGGATVVTRTFSKAYALAGARVGWGLFPPAVGTEVRKLLNPNNITGVSQAMARAAIADRDHVAEVVRETVQSRDRLSNQLRSFGMEVPESHTNFVLVRFADTATAQAADGALRGAGLIARGMAGYGLPDALRITIGPEAAMDLVAKVLRGVAEGD